MTEQVPSLRRGWATASLSELTELITSGSRGWAAYYSDHGPLFLRIGNLDRGTLKIDLKDVVHVVPPNGEEGIRTRVQPGDVLLSITADVGMVGLVDADIGEAYVNQHIALIRPLSSIFARGLAYSLLDPRGLQAVVQKEKYGATKPGLSLIQVRSLKVPLPPLTEHRRIVDAIESHLSRLDDAEKTLRRVERNLKRYRASVLKAAVEGRLVPTEADLARVEGRDYEPASRLLERILAERRRRWEEAELAKMTAAGKPPKDDRWKGKYEAPVDLDLTVLPALPDGWHWASLDALAQVKGGITKDQKREHDPGLREVPYLRVANVQRGYLDLTEVASIRASEEDIRELRLELGDVLFNEGGDRDKLGRGWVWNAEINECIHQNHVFRARIYGGELHPKLLSWYGNSAGQKYFFSEGKQTTNLASLNSTKLKKLPVPIPPKAEQLRIVADVERRLSLADEAELLVRADLKRCARLRQSILKWAFEGKLADQDPTDEPASALLDRIRAERAAAAETPKKPASRGRPKKASTDKTP